MVGLCLQGVFERGAVNWKSMRVALMDLWC